MSSLRYAASAVAGAGRLAPHAHLRQVRHQHLEMDDAVTDALFGDLYGGNVAGVSQHGRCAVANLAHRGDGYVAAL